MHVISAAGPEGLSREEIALEIQLDRKMLDQLLAALVQIGQISIAQENGDQIFRASNFGWQ
jgi:DNA-binding transcriptional regulator LsrR (DeoR family)